MRKIYLLIIPIFLFISLTAYSQTINISGYIREKDSGEILPGANITVLNSDRGISANAQGFYSICLLKGKNQINCSFIGFEPLIFNVDLTKDTLINLYLKQSYTEIEAVTVSAENTKHKFLTERIGIERITATDIKKQPVFMGESDLMKSLQLLPGVQSGNEGSSGLYVRGGSPDQNLILLDGVPVYNAYHLFGFFSVFNTDAIREVKLYKGGIPARYGGRLSSVLDITMKEGNLNEYHGEITIGLIASKFVAEGPIKKGKGSFLITGRRTIVDYFGKQLNSWFLNTKGSDENNFYFYDINAKFNYLLGEKSRLFVSFYMGEDKSSTLSEDTEKSIIDDYEYSNKNTSNLNWGNLIASVRYHQVIAPKLFSNITAYYSSYEYNSSENVLNTITSSGITNKKETKRNYISDVSDLGSILNFDYIPTNNIRIKFGAKYIYHNYKPGIESFKVSDKLPDQDIDTLFGQKYNSYEYCIYSEIDWQIGKYLKANIGINYNNYSTGGKSYGSIEPRVALNLMFNNNFSFKASYSQLSQNTHLLSNNTLGMPTDLWLPATKRIAPQKGDISSLGLFYSGNKAYFISVEGFYKSSRNIIAYHEGTNYFSGSLNWEDKVVSGIGWSYGGEIYIKKTSGKITGSIAYTLAKTQRKFEKINYGEVFPYKYDRRHDFSINVNYAFSEKFDIGATWVYGTGTAVTVSNQISENIIFYDGFNSSVIFFHINEKMNSLRMPAYHRLDLGLNFHRKLKWAERTFSFGVYNAYNRNNPYYLYIYYPPSGPAIAQKSLFPILPYLSYNLKF